MRRREFISLVGGATIAWPLAARAQQPPVVGYLGLTSVRTDAYYMASFRKALSEAGFDDGRNVNIESRFAEGDIGRLPGLAAELVRRKVAIIFTATTVSAIAAKAATSTIPVVLSPWCSSRSCCRSCWSTKVSATTAIARRMATASNIPSTKSANFCNAAPRGRLTAAFLLRCMSSAICTKRTSPSALHMSAFDPKRTSVSRYNGLVLASGEVMRRCE